MAVVAQRIPRIEAPAAEEFERAFVAPRRPVILRGLVSHWPALQRWSFEYLRSAFSGAVVPAVHLRDGQVVIDPRQGLLHDRLPLPSFLDALHEGAADRYMVARLDELPPALAADVPAPTYCANAAFQSCKVWIGAAGTVSSLHRDLADNLHAQVSGRKRFTLVSPRHSAGVYPNRLWASVPNGCGVDVEQPDFARFPKLRGVETTVAELEPGDVIYIPRRWWHHVRTLERSVSVNFWWATGRRRALVVAADWIKRARRISR